MLVICSGPDTASALKRTVDYVAGFKMKYDPSGFSVEVLRSPVMSEVLNRVSAPSFFSSKRMIRVDGLIENSKIADIRLLAKRLISDNGQTVVITYEHEPVAKKIIDEFEKKDIAYYEHPLMHGMAFVDWCVKRGSVLGVVQDVAREIALSVNEDMLLAEQELCKASANPNAVTKKANIDFNIYELAEKYFHGKKIWKEDMEPMNDEKLAKFLYSSRSLLKRNLFSISFLALVKTHAAIRSGLASIFESETLM